MVRMGRTAVIGAGPAGCAAAHKLREAGRDVVLFEAEPFVGGRTRTYRDAGLQIDTGAGFFTNFYPTLLDYNARLGLTSDALPLARTQWLIHDGRPADLRLGSLRSFVAYPFLGLGAKLRMLLHTARWTLRRGGLDLADPATLAPLDDRSVADEARRAVGEAAYQFLVRPGIEPFWYFSCENVSRAMLLALQAHAADAKFFTYAGGMDSLAQALTRSVERLLETRVTSVQIADHGVRVTYATQDGPEREEHFDDAVVATTATVANRLTAELGSDRLPDVQRRFLSSQRYVANVHAVFFIDAADAPPDVATIMPTGPGAYPVAAVAFASRKYPDAGRPRDGREAVQVYLSDRAARDMLHADDEELADTCWRLARELYPALPERAEFHTAFRRAEAIPLHGVGRYREAIAFQHAQRPPLAFAGDYLATATVEGAMRTGLAAAERLLTG